MRTVTIDLATGSQRDATAADRIGEPLPDAARPSADGAIDRGTSTGAGETPAAAPEAGTPASASAMPEAAPASVSPAPKTPTAVVTEGGAAAPTPEAVVPTQPKPAAPGAGASAAPAPTTAKPPSAAGPAATRPALVETKPAAGAKPGSDARPGADAKLAADSKTPSDAAKPAAQPTTPPRPAAPTASAAEGWVVQLGSFASRPNAERLVAELRAKGYAGFVSEFRGSGRVLYRVRVGPEQDRARAEAIAQRLARDGKKGTVAPHP